MPTTSHHHTDAKVIDAKAAGHTTASRWPETLAPHPAPAAQRAKDGDRWAAPTFAPLAEEGA